LVLQVTGIGGHSGLVVGLIDSGADVTSLPARYAPLMGYGTTANLQTETFGQVSGTGNALGATVPCSAVVPEFAEVVVELWPSFIAGSEMVLWGRRDVLARFDVTIMESRQAFTIAPAPG
jgi:hypothetical protein